MSPLESSLNPFYIEKPEEDKFDDSAEVEKDSFAFLPRQEKGPKASEIIGPDSIQL